MKILVVSQYFWPENFKINDLCEGLIERGHEVTVYAGMPNYPEGKLFNGYSFFKGPYVEYKGKVKIIRCPLITRGKNKGFRLALNYISFCLLSTFLAPFLVRGKYDKIFAYQLSPIFAALPAVFLKFLKRAPMIIWVTDLWPESLEATHAVTNKKLLKIVEVFVKFIYLHCDKILISSQGFAEKIKALNVPEKKIKFWPQWAESFFGPSANANIVNDPSIPEGFKVMFAGNIGTAQDFETIIEAATILKNEANIQFLILGDGLMKKWAVEQLEVRHLEKTFHFLGRKPIESMPAYYSQSDVLLVSLTDTELFSITIPSKVQTYLASGKPILAALNGEGAKIVDEWKAGYSCPATNPKALADTIVKMSKLSKEDLNQLGVNAYNCYKSEFEREKLISSLEQDLKSLQY
ncbi:MAG: glycosyltransferase family 4 protein [Bacteriovorax sp.]|nr:glycosyltransferase family 4 protein [Bacteriovorax sp.]